MSDPAETLPLEVRRVSALERIADALDRLTGRATPARVAPSPEPEEIEVTDMERARSCGACVELWRMRRAVALDKLLVALEAYDMEADRA